MRIGIVGSRYFTNMKLMVKVLKYNMKERDDITLIVSGGAKGADTLAERYAEGKGIETKIFLPDWNKYGRKAGFLRNIDIVKNSDLVFAFWDGISPGTKHLIDLCKQYKVECIVTKFE